jgi:hypothetical protein
MRERNNGVGYPDYWVSLGVLIGLALILIGLLGLLLASPAHGHDMAKAHTRTEERVFEFYSTWMRPPERNFSCCDQRDCTVVEIKREGTHWFFMDKIYQHGWRYIPEDRLEHNWTDARESPDGSSHVCFNATYVLCAVLGSGQ